jgi:hypothetical protein
MANTDEEETMPMYTPKIREEPLPVHDHPWPELNPKRIAPDGVTTPRTTTERLPAFLSFVMVILLIFMAACGPTQPAPGDAQPVAENLAACRSACTALTVACGWASADACEARCGAAIPELDAACVPESAAWYGCMAGAPPDLECSDRPAAVSCDWAMDAYLGCMAEGAS